MIIPGTNGTATFTGASPLSISMAGGVAVGTLSFNAANYTFDVLNGLTINGNGVIGSFANAPTFNVVSTVGATPAIQFNGTSSAGTAQFILGQVVDTNNGFNAGFINFGGTSTAGQATITTRDASATNFFNSSTAGQATLIVENGGFVGFNDQSNGAQATVINNAGGEVGLFGLSTAGTTLGSIAGDGTFTLTSKNLTVGSNNNSTEVGGTITGDGGSLVKVGTGSLTLSGLNTYTGTTTVNNGALIVNGSIAPSILTTVNSNAALLGTGTVGSASINAGGFLVPGPGTPTPGTMAVRGNLVFQSGASYIVQVNPATASNTNVSGSAALAGTVAAVFAPGAYSTRDYPILTANGGLLGTFNMFETRGLPADFGASVEYSSNTAFLHLRAQLVPEPPITPTPPPTLPTVPPPVIPPVPGLPPAAQPAPPDQPLEASPAPLPVFTVNQLNVGHAIDNFFNNGGTLPPAFIPLFNLTGGNLTNALDQLSGEPATDAEKGAFKLMDQFLGLMLDPFADGRSGTGWPSGGGNAMGFAPEQAVNFPPDVALAYAGVLKAPPKPATLDQHWSVWGGSFGGSNTTNGDPVIGSTNVTARDYGFAGGMDYHASPDIVYGFALAGGGTNWGLAQGLGGGRSDAFQAGVYGATRSGPTYVSAALAFANHWMTTDRYAFGGDHLNASFDGQSYAGRLEAGYRYAVLPMIGVTPYAALQVQDFHTPGYSETDLTGGGFGLSYNSMNATDTRSELGARFDDMTMIGAMPLSLRARAAWAHDWVSTPNLMPVFQALPGSAFIVYGAAAPKNSALASAGAELHLTANWSLAAKFDGEFASGSQTYAGTGTLRYMW